MAKQTRRQAEPIKEVKKQPLILTTKIGNVNYEYFSTPYFELDGRKYTIIGTISTGRNYWTQTIDIVKNDKGEYKQFTRESLLAFIHKHQNKN